MDIYYSVIYTKYARYARIYKRSYRDIYKPEKVRQAILSDFGRNAAPTFQKMYWNKEDRRFWDFYEKPEAQAVLTSSDTKLFLAQDKSEIQYLKEVFKLSEGEAGFLINCLKGEGLLKVGGETAIIQITPTQKEFEFVETNVNKMARMQKMKNGMK